MAYGPRIELRNEGLGRHLAEFLRASLRRDDVEFVIAAPSWMRDHLRDLMDGFGVSEGQYEILGPTQSSLSWSAFQTGTRVRKWLSRVRKKDDVKKGGLLLRIKFAGIRLVSRVTRYLMRTRNPLVFVATVILALSLLPFAALIYLLRNTVLKGVGRLRRSSTLRRMLGTTQPAKPRIFGLLGRMRHHLYQTMCDEEARLVAEMANRRDDISAWYCPTAFWPQFNLIEKPRLTCVPDVVFTGFPVGFATDEPAADQLFNNFRRIESIIDAGHAFVTYSKHVKQKTLVERFQVKGSSVHVVPHGANRLDELITVTGFADNRKASDALSAQYFWSATSKATNNWNGVRFSSGDLGFVFYASQFRPNKNVVTLLKAYRWLRREKLLRYKLILTGAWQADREVNRYLTENNLHDDVLCLRNLTERELAACYNRAVLAVNPSLSEGGMPFTFTEAVSVGTPVVMADIPVTKEILTDKVVHQKTVFNPESWTAMAEKIEWAIQHKDSLYKIQRAFYDEVLVNRTWDHVVADYIDILNDMAGKPFSYTPEIVERLNEAV